MRTIAQNFKIILDRQNSMGYDFKSILRSPATADDIARTEQNLDIEFSQELHELYSFANGTKREVNSFYMIGLIPFYMFMDLRDAEHYYSLSEKDFELNDIDYGGQFTMWDNKFTPGRKLFPILHNGSGDCYWIDLNTNTENWNKVYWTNTIPESPAYIFDSLTSMFQTIAESYEQNVFSFETKKYLEENYEQWGIIGKKNNPDLKYWDEYLNGE